MFCIWLLGELRRRSEDAFEAIATLVAVPAIEAPETDPAEIPVSDSLPESLPERRGFDAVGEAPHRLER